MAAYTLMTNSGSPYDQRLHRAPGDGAANWSPLLIGSDMIVETKALGSKQFAADQSTGKLAVPSMLNRVPGAFNNAAFYGNGFGFTDDVKYRNRLRKIRDQLQNHTTDFRLDGRMETRTPIALPNIIPAFYFQ